MAFLIVGLSVICGLTSLVCWILTLIKVFPESIGKGILALLCPLYALIWAWQNKETVGPNVVTIWTVAVVINILLNVVSAVVLRPA